MPPLKVAWRQQNWSSFTAVSCESRALHDYIHVQPASATRMKHSMPWMRTSWLADHSSSPPSQACGPSKQTRCCRPTWKCPPRTLHLCTAPPSTKVPPNAYYHTMSYKRSTSRYCLYMHRHFLVVPSLAKTANQKLACGSKGTASGRGQEKLQTDSNIPSMVLDHEWLKLQHHGFSSYTVYSWVLRRGELSR